MWHSKLYSYLLYLCSYLHHLHCTLQIVYSWQTFVDEIINSLYSSKHWMQRIAVYFSNQCRVSYYTCIRKPFLIFRLSRHIASQYLSSLTAITSNWVSNNSGLPWWQESCKHPRETTTTSTFSEIRTTNFLSASLTWLLLSHACKWNFRRLIGSFLTWGQRRLQLMVCI